jgi:hypothetical protein
LFIPGYFLSLGKGTSGTAELGFWTKNSASVTASSSDACWFGSDQPEPFRMVWPLLANCVLTAFNVKPHIVTLTTSTGQQT